MLGVSTALAEESLRIGRVTALGGESAKSGAAIARGIGLAIDEANPSKGVLIARVRD